ncbi:DUF3164 family protein [Arcobacter aquimarinus]|uniref:DUF3164 domain-containing protein n=1 Tax=Arcobacter aquimarinus TaxID=1315211 RepID=A0AAE7E0N3_9BACT|nr:DUF3164 family protein [Arcobacter aquimarinus]QKE26198.1 DUF3164 domain-containing protein [Arcobacter aquimarinus]RXI35803.1 hypothetical protein CP986_05325 [Arcobacter aquimarinus]
MPIIDDKGWWQDKTGEYKHPARIDIDEQLEDELVEKIHAKGLKLQAAILEYKDFVYSECYAFLDNLREEYNIERLKGKTERITLKSFNGTKEFKISVNNLIDYNQVKVELAKEKFLQYANLKIKDIEDNDIKTIVLGALEPKNGKYDDRDIQKLINWGFEHPFWKEGVELLQSARITTGTKSYINLRQKEELKLDGMWEGIVLDLAALPIQDTVIQKSIEFIKWKRNLLRRENKFVFIEAGDDYYWRKLFDEGKSIDEALAYAKEEEKCWQEAGNNIGEK